MISIGCQNDGSSILCKDSRAKALLPNHFIIVPCVSRPAGHELERRWPNVGHSVGHVSRNIMDAAGSHCFGENAPRVIHHQEHTCSLDAAVVLAAIAYSMAMAVGHEIFLTYSPRLDHGCAPKQSSLRAFRHRSVPSDAIDCCVQIHGLQGQAIMIELVHLPQFSDTLENILSSKVTAAPIHE